MNEREKETFRKGLLLARFLRIGTPAYAEHYY